MLCISAPDASKYYHGLSRISLMSWSRPGRRSPMSPSADSSGACPDVVGSACRHSRPYILLSHIMSCRDVGSANLNGWWFWYPLKHCHGIFFPQIKQFTPVKILNNLFIIMKICHVFFLWGGNLFIFYQKLQYLKKYITFIGVLCLNKNKSNSLCFYDWIKLKKNTQFHTVWRHLYLADPATFLASVFWGPPVPLRTAFFIQLSM